MKINARTLKPYPSMEHFTTITGKQYPLHLMFKLKDHIGCSKKPFIQQRKKGHLPNDTFIHSKHHMNLAYDVSSMASLLLVSCIGSASFSSLQLLKELMYGFDSDRLIDTGKE